MTNSMDRPENTDSAAAACLDVYRLCTTSAQHCLNVRRDDAVRRCAGALRDGAEVALLLAGLLARRSPFAEKTVPLCAEAVRQAATAISGLEHADGQLRATYAACQNLLRVCRELTAGGLASESDDRDEALLETFPASDATPTVTHAT
ncbi:MAG TPA: hypothetical protein VF190_11685 [Rhodothermales bacterium]